MKKILTKKILAFLFMSISILFFYLMYSHYEKERMVRLETSGRLLVLESIRDTILKSNVPLKNLSLYAILETDNMRGFEFIIPGYDSSEVQKKFKNFTGNWDRESFYNYCQYRLIKDDLNWWAIVELKSGKHNKCFLMLTCDGKLIEIKTPFLPAQFKTTPLEYKNWGTYRGIDQ